MTASFSTTACASPGLSALVLYARPAERSGIIGCLVNQGLFVAEHDLATQSVHDLPPGNSGHIVVVCLADHAAHREFARRVVETGPVMIAIVPVGCSTEWLLELGVWVVEGDQDSEALRVAVRNAGQVARGRAMEVFAPAAQWRRVFGSLVFRTNQPWLKSGREIAALSSTEHGVLSALVHASGEMVTKLELRRQLGSSDSPASDAYLKTIVLRIRRKVERLGGDPRELVSVRGVGYLLRSNN